MSENEGILSKIRKETSEHSYDVSKFSWKSVMEILESAKKEEPRYYLPPQPFIEKTEDGSFLIPDKELKKALEDGVEFYPCGVWVYEKLMERINSLK